MVKISTQYQEVIEMLRFIFADPEISAQQSPSSRYPTVVIHRSISTESRSFSPNSSALDI